MMQVAPPRGDIEDGASTLERSKRDGTLDVFFPIAPRIFREHGSNDELANNIPRW